MLPPTYPTIGTDAARFLYDWLRDPLLCYPPPTLLLGQMLPVIFYMIGCAMLYCATPPYTAGGADAARFFYTVGCAILYCASPLHYCCDRCCPFFVRLATRSSTMLPFLHGMIRDPSLSYPLHYT